MTTNWKGIGSIEVDPWMINEIQKRERERKREREYGHRLPVPPPAEPDPLPRERPDQGFGYIELSMI